MWCFFRVISVVNFLAWKNGWNSSSEISGHVGDQIFSLPAFFPNQETNRQTDQTDKTDRTGQDRTGQTDRQTDRTKQNKTKHEKFEDLSPTQLTVSNSSQSSVDSVSLFLSDLSQVLEPSLSQAVRVLDSVMECAVVWVQCMYILALPLDIDSVDQCHILYNTCSDLNLQNQ